MNADHAVRMATVLLRTDLQIVFELQPTRRVLLISPISSAQRAQYPETQYRQKKILQLSVLVLASDRCISISASIMLG